MTFESFILINNMSIEHYENFPVASLLLPRHLRPAVETVYTFARTADDFADEGDFTNDERLEKLNHYQDELNKIANGEMSNHALFIRLRHHIHEFQIPISYFHNLLSAFKQDITTTRYTNYAELLNYCNYSANPVGRIMLHFYKATNQENLSQSDAICSALQIINFIQDVGIDWNKNRIYLPLEDLDRFELPHNTLQAQSMKNWPDMMRFQVQRARELMQSGSQLSLNLSGRIGWELRLVVQGGLRILEKIEACNYDVFHRRPTITKLDVAILCWRAARMKKSK
jgi:squalene synthase HpnC